MDMEVREKVRRFLHPQCLEDYGISVDLRDVAREAPEEFAAEFAPFLPKHVVEECKRAK